MSIKLSSAKELAWSATLWGIISIFSFLLRVDLFKQAWGGPSLLTVIKAKKGATLAQEEAWRVRELPQNLHGYQSNKGIWTLRKDRNLKYKRLLSRSGWQAGDFLPSRQNSDLFLNMAAYLSVELTQTPATPGALQKLLKLHPGEGKREKIPLGQCIKNIKKW